MPNHANITVLGHLGRDPEMKETNSGKAMTKTVVAVSTGWGDNKTTTWWNVTAFGPQAEWLARDGRKGSLVLVSGEPEVRTYEKQDGSKGWSADILAREVRVIDRSDGQQSEAPPSAGKKSMPPPAPVDDAELPF